MRALVCERFGAPPVIAEVDEPVAGPGQVLVAQEASSVCAGDVLMAEGRPWLFRPVFTAMLGRGGVLGRDVAGQVVAIGSGVEGLSVGDRVIGEAAGAWASRVALDAAALARVPAGVSWSQAATLPVSGITALQALKGRVQPGQEVLIVGASGGVGHFAVQIARELGARVTGVCSAVNAERVLALGAVRLIDHQRERFTDQRATWDVVLDLAGEFAIGDCLGTLRPGGIYIASAGTNGGTLLGPLPRIVQVAVRGLWDRRVALHTTSPVPADLEHLLGEVVAGRLVPWIREETTLDGLAERWAGMGSGGKWVVRWDGPERHPDPEPASDGGNAASDSPRKDGAEI